MKLLATLADRVLNWFAPPITVLPPYAPGSAQWLAIAEQARENWEKGEIDCHCFPEGWEEQIHDAVYDNDGPDPAPGPPIGRPGAAPAGAAHLPPEAAPVGFPDLKRVIEPVLRDCGVKYPWFISEMVAIELHHHFESFNK